MCLTRNKFTLPSRRVVYENEFETHSIDLFSFVRTASSHKQPAILIWSQSTQPTTTLSVVVRFAVAIKKKRKMRSFHQ